MATRDDVIRAARKEIGYVETPVNRTKYGKWYGMNGVAWCVIFISYILASVKALALLGGKKAYTPFVVNYFKSINRYHLGSSGIKRGHFAIFSFGGKRPDHIGLVESVVDKDTVITIEGNTSTADQRNGGMVMRRKRNRKLIIGYCVPKYDPVAPKVASKSTATVKTRGTVLNIRKSDNTKSPVVTKAPNGAKVTVEKRGKSWSKVTYKGVTGYAFNNFLRF